MREYRKQREDFVVWIPQLVGKSPETWIDNTKVPKHEYYQRLQNCKVGVQMRQTNYGWSVSGTIIDEWYSNDISDHYVIER